MIFSKMGNKTAKKNGKMKKEKRNRIMESAHKRKDEERDHETE